MGATDEGAQKSAAIGLLGLTPDYSYDVLSKPAS
jgi:hypothetical protein